MRRRARGSLGYGEELIAEALELRGLHMIRQQHIWVDQGASTYYRIDLARFPLGVEIETDKPAPHLRPELDWYSYGGQRYLRALWLIERGWQLLYVKGPSALSYDATEIEVYADMIETYAAEIEADQGMPYRFVRLRRSDRAWLVTDGWVEDGMLVTVDHPDPPEGERVRRRRPAYRRQKGYDPERGARLRESRKLAGLQRGQVEARTGIWTSDVRLYEEGEPVPGLHWYVLAEALEMSDEDFDKMMLGISQSCEERVD